MASSHLPQRHRDWDHADAHSRRENVMLEWKWTSLTELSHSLLPCSLFVFPFISFSPPLSSYSFWLTGDSTSELLLGCHKFSVAHTHSPYWWRSWKPKQWINDDLEYRFELSYHKKLWKNIKVEKLFWQKTQCWKKTVWKKVLRLLLVYSWYQLFLFLSSLTPVPRMLKQVECFLLLSNYLSPPVLTFLPPSHFASGLLVVMESLSPCELLSLMSLLSHTPYQINRLHQPITTQTHQPGPRQTHRLTSLHQQSQSVIDKTWCKQRKEGGRQRKRQRDTESWIKIYTSVLFWFFYQYFHYLLDVIRSQTARVNILTLKASLQS